jgi:ABC-2 type transport system ATP-binding protein
LGARVGYVPHSDALPAHQTGHAFVRDLLRFHGHTAAEAGRVAARTLERVGLAGVADRRLAGYSKGMRQRLKLAQALAHDPPLMILDEPLTGLDPVGRRDIIQLVRGMGDAGRTVLVSSHILHEVEAMTDRVALMRSGRMVAAGRIDDLRSGLLAHPYRVRAEVDRPRGLAARLVADPAVTSVRIEDDGHLRIETPDPDALLARLTVLAADGAIVLTRLAVEDQDLEAVFRYTVDR